MPDVQSTLPVLPEESFQRVLCVVAHPDDVEYGTSAAGPFPDRGQMTVNGPTDRFGWTNRLPGPAARTRLS
jgi:hypothetical protein